MIALALCLGSLGCDTGGDLRPGDAAPSATATPAASDPAATAAGDPTPHVEDQTQAIDLACATAARVVAGESDYADLDDADRFEAHLRDHGALLEELAPQIEALGSPRDVSRAGDLRWLGATARSLAEELGTHRAANTDLPVERVAEVLTEIDWMTEVMAELRLWELAVCEDPAGISITPGEIDGTPHNQVDVEPSPWFGRPDED
ncbi:hypothetical protein [Nitriliruptor alkaliphilus]|uniref:hypothetical protein n=1 Tax=Nitriliruptor alkaliphilus TaxID=427918 RepID=UPI0012EDA62E|nr:hypothetical protein [Nitriliruptor alkaliphilus]